jgi:hypothetical protein
VRRPRDYGYGGASEPAMELSVLKEFVQQSDAEIIHTITNPHSGFLELLQTPDYINDDAVRIMLHVLSKVCSSQTSPQTLIKVSTSVNAFQFMLQWKHDGNDIIYSNFICFVQCINKLSIM